MVQKHPSILDVADEESHLLMGGQKEENANTNNSHTGSSNGSRRAFDFMGGIVVALACYFVINMSSSGSHSNSNNITPSTSTTNSRSNSQTIQMAINDHGDFIQPKATPPTTATPNTHKRHDGRTDTSKYKRFQAMGFQIYTGGAPALINVNPKEPIGNPNATYMHNPECADLNSYGKVDDFDDDDLANTNLTLTQLNLWECYLGRSNPKKDVEQRLRIMVDAVEKAHATVMATHGNNDEETLKIFVAPEFFWRGKDGAYVFSDASSPKAKARHAKYFKTTEHNDDDDEDCEEVCLILKGLEALVADKKYKDWLFLFGTVIVSETLPLKEKEKQLKKKLQPEESDMDHLFYNFAPLYRGYDPEETDYYGKRFLVPKRYVSNIDFLTPVRQFNDSTTKELFDAIHQQKHVVEQEEDEDQDKDSTTVHNPFTLDRDFYDTDLWYTYKDELNGLGYTMLEYDWVVLDNITFSVEVCLDHEAQTAIKTYLADNVLGSPTLIPKHVETYDHDLQRHTGSIHHVGIPRHQAQLSLVSSSGMSVNPNSLALANNGTIILQDGLSSKEGSMSQEVECERMGWHFAGGSEHISRTAKLTSTEISFQFQIHSGHRQVGIWDDLENDADTTWKDHIRGVFTTERYEPKITIYSPKDVAKV